MNELAAFPGFLSFIVACFSLGIVLFVPGYLLLKRFNKLGFEGDKTSELPVFFEKLFLSFISSLFLLAFFSIFLVFSIGLTRFSLIAVYAVFFLVLFVWRK